jgi:NAD(P)-dependent dehydrogenase (short-subunit alcohol dehydrogenase family)
MPPTVFTPTITNYTSPYPAIDPTRPGLSAKGKAIVIGGEQGIGLSIALGSAKANASHTFIFWENTIRSQLRTVRNSVFVPLNQSPRLRRRCHGRGSHLQQFRQNPQRDSPINSSNASYFNTLGSLAYASVLDWFKSFEVMVQGPLIVAQAFFRHKSTENTAFIDISSSAVLMAPFGFLGLYIE